MKRAARELSFSHEGCPSGGLGCTKHQPESSSILQMLTHFFKIFSFQSVSTHDKVTHLSTHPVSVVVENGHFWQAFLATSQHGIGRRSGKSSLPRPLAGRDSAKKVPKKTRK